MATTRVVRWVLLQPGPGAVKVSYEDSYLSPADNTKTVVNAVEEVLPLGAPENAAIAATVITLKAQMIARLTTPQVVPTVSNGP